MLEYRKVMARGLKGVRSLFRAEENYVREYCKSVRVRYHLSIPSSTRNGLKKSVCSQGHRARIVGLPSHWRLLVWWRGMISQSLGILLKKGVGG